MRANVGFNSRIQAIVTLGKAKRQPLLSEYREHAQRLGIRQQRQNILET
jgi:hypothetical protein